MPHHEEAQTERDRRVWVVESSSPCVLVITCAAATQVACSTYTVTVVYLTDLGHGQPQAWRIDLRAQAQRTDLGTQALAQARKLRGLGGGVHVIEWFTLNMYTDISHIYIYGLMSQSYILVYHQKHFLFHAAHQWLQAFRLSLGHPSNYITAVLPTTSAPWMYLFSFIGN